MRELGSLELSCFVIEILVQRQRAWKKDGRDRKGEVCRKKEIRETRDG